MNINIDTPNLNLPDFNSPNFDLSNLNLPDFNPPNFDLSNLNLPDFNPPNLSIDNLTILELTNTEDTNIIDESDGLSLGEAIEIVNNDRDNNYVIEVPSGSTYTATLDENLSNPIILRSTGDDVTKITITSGSTSGESVQQLTLRGESIFSLGDSGVDNDNNNINFDSEALTLNGETAQIAYVAYYGRPADPGGVNFWNQALTDGEVNYSPRNGDPLTGQEQDIYNRIVNQFGTSDEADRLFGDLDNNRDRVDRVYQFAFDRNGDESGLDYWTEQIDNGNITLASFALEVALGARGEDIVVLNNKINSANLFSESIDTDAERNAYSGSSAEVFGREWLDGFKDTTSSQEQVNSAQGNLVSGDF